MGSIYARRKKLWLKFRDASGEIVRRSSGLAIGQEKKAREILRDIEASIDASTEITGKDGGPVTLAVYITTFHKRRAGRVGAADKELANLRNHVEPRLGAMPLAEVRPRHVRDLVLQLRAGAKLAPGAIRHVYGVLRRLMREAVLDELIESNPCDLPAGILPERVDKDPEWREQAVYTRAELEQLISDERIPLGRRVLYALKGLGALRHGEAAGLRWRHYDASCEPLGALTVANSYLRKGTKTGVTRRMPVHPALAALLAEWKLSGWAAERGRKPEAEDLIVPNARGNVKASQEAQDQLVDDLVLLGLRTRAGEFRNRGGHDLRATFISLAAEDGAVPDIIERGTHAPRRTVRSGYQRFTWAAICAEVAKLRVRLRAPAQVVGLGVAVATVHGAPAELADPVSTSSGHLSDESAAAEGPRGGALAVVASGTGEPPTRFPAPGGRGRDEYLSPSQGTRLGTRTCSPATSQPKKRNPRLHHATGGSSRRVAVRRIRARDEDVPSLERNSCRPSAGSSPERFRMLAFLA